MKKTLLLGLTLISCAASAAGMSEHAESAAAASGIAVVASGIAVGEGAAASGQLASGVAAVPLKAVGAVGAMADKAGDALLDVAGVEPLPVSEITVTTVTIAPPPSAE
ncbi:hypothetical protein D3C87_466290 [compost metagenome]